MLPPQKDYLSPKDRKGVLFPYPHLPRVKIKCKIPSFLSREESLLEKAGLYSFPLKVFFFSLGIQLNCGSPTLPLAGRI
jgi:hypothetical protein